MRGAEGAALKPGLERALEQFSILESDLTTYEQGESE